MVPLDDLATERIPCTAENILELMCKHVEMVPRLSHPSACSFSSVTITFFMHGRCGLKALSTEMSSVCKDTHNPEQLKVILDETELLVRGNRGDTITFTFTFPFSFTVATPQPSSLPIINSSDIPTYSLAELPEAPNLDPSQQFAMPKELKNTCKHCRDNPDEDQWCIRRYYVHELPNYEELDGCVITTAPEDECLDPKAKEGSSSPQYYHPDELGLKQIKPQPEVFDLCKRDVTLLVNDDSILVADALIYTAQGLYKPVTKHVGKYFVTQGMDPMGSGGGNLYVCRNYCSHMHKDRDASMSICMQSKKRCKEGEWNFVYLRLFDANHIHGSTMPGKSTLMRRPYLRRERVPNDAQSQQGGDPQEQGAEGGNGEGAQDQHT
ncbi:hypothetical protein IMY05_C4455000100 [Salix suchowensis]|nr:hypothetical protein IMY05_C4455000100 [Salix suchowensis]